MIRIEERPSRKVAGSSSLFVSCPYDQRTLNCIKSCDVRFWHKDSKEWEVPLLSLSSLIDMLVYYDDVSFKAMDHPSESAGRKPVLKHKTKPYGYQMEGIEYGLNHAKWLLLDAPGLGKTLQMICLAEELREQEGIGHCLIICGIASLRSNWRKEIRKHSRLECRIVGERVGARGGRHWATMAERAEELSKPIDEFFVVVNIESLRDQAVVDAIRNGPNDYGLAVFDECHKAKGPQAVQSKGLLQLSFPHEVAMTGTLLVKNPIDAYVPLAWIGKEPLRGVTRFKNTYCVFDDRIKGRIIGFKNLDLLKEEIESCSLRRTKDLLDLPPMNFVDESLEMGDAQAAFYSDIKDSVVSEISLARAKDKADRVELKATSLLAVVTRLRQATTCPSALTSDAAVGSAKMDRAEELARELAGNGEKVVIFSTFKEPVRELASRLADLKPLVGTGDMREQDVSDAIDEFQSDPRRKVFLGTVDKMGTGVTLTAASYMVFVDQPWSYALYEQACDRIHRIGSKKPCFIYNLSYEGTIDEAVASALERKRAMSDFVIDDKTDADTLKALSRYVSDLASA